MELPKTELKIPNMIMCGDHPSFTKTELNFKERTDNDKPHLSSPRVSPVSSKMEKEMELTSNTKAVSDHALRLLEVRRCNKSLEGMSLDHNNLPTHRSLLQAALGSFRWPPYLLLVWILLLVVTHALHCVLTVLTMVLPHLKRVCQQFRQWTERAWAGWGAGRGSGAGPRAGPLLLAAATGALYAALWALQAAHALVLWAVEPLGVEEPRRMLDSERSERSERSESKAKL